MARTRISQGEADQIFLIYREIETSISELARVFHHTRATIRRIVHGHWIERPPSNREQLTERKREQRLRWKRENLEACRESKERYDKSPKGRERALTASRRWAERNPDYQSEYSRRPEVRARKREQAAARREKKARKRDEARARRALEKARASGDT